MWWFDGCSRFADVAGGILVHKIPTSRRNGYRGPGEHCAGHSLRDPRFQPRFRDPGSWRRCGVTWLFGAHRGSYLSVPRSLGGAMWLAPINGMWVEITCYIRTEAWKDWWSSLTFHLSLPWQPWGPWDEMLVDKRVPRPLSGVWQSKSAAAAAKSLQSCPTLCDSIDSSPPGSPVPGILQAKILEWVAISFSSAWKWKVKVKLLSHVRILATIWTAAYHTPPSLGFFRQKYWSWVPLPSPTIPLHIFVYLLNFWVYGTLLLTMYTLLYSKSVELFHFA